MAPVYQDRGYRRLPALRCPASTQPATTESQTIGVPARYAVEQHSQFPALVAGTGALI